VPSDTGEVFQRLAFCALTATERRPDGWYDPCNVVVMVTLESVVRPRPLPLNGLDRRAHGRVAASLPVLVDTQRDWGSLRAVDVSASGLAVLGAFHAPAGTVVDVYFELPSGVAIETKAKVVRVESDRTALQFVSLSHEEEVAIRAHCRRAEAHG
jgi:hypothetical protein